jgi:hypothetical protein
MITYKQETFEWANIGSDAKVPLDAVTVMMLQYMRRIEKRFWMWRINV